MWLLAEHSCSALEATRLERATCFVNLSCPGFVEFDDMGAAARGGAEQPLALQDEKCLAHRNPAYGELIGDFHFIEPLSGQQPTTPDRLNDLVRDPF